MSDVLTIPLADSVAARLRKLSEGAGKEVEDVVASVLEDAIPQIDEDIPDDIRRAMEALESNSDDELIRVAKSQLDVANRPVAYEEGDASDKLMLCKAYALALLKWRGKRLTLDELQRA